VLPALSDWNAEAAKGFDVAFDYRGLKDVSGRSAFLIDGQGVIRGSWHYETSELPDFDVLLEAVRGIS
jgi:peroxiredoxin